MCQTAKVFYLFLELWRNMKKVYENSELGEKVDLLYAGLVYPKIPLPPLFPDKQILQNKSISCFFVLYIASLTAKKKHFQNVFMCLAKLNKWCWRSMCVRVRLCAHTWHGEVQPVKEGALSGLHLRAGVVQGLPAPHNRTQGFLQGAV